MKSLQRVLFLQQSSLVEAQHLQVQQQLHLVFPNIELISAGCSEDISVGLDVDVVITPTMGWLSAALERLGGYRWIHFLSAGVESIWDMPFNKHDVIMTKSSGVHGIPMSEYTLGAMLYFAKRFDQFVHQMKECHWQRAWLDELTGRTVTIVGMGHVGGFVAKRAKSMGMRVIGVQRIPREHEFADVTVALADVSEYFKQTDYLVVCLPLTDRTKGVVDQRFLSELKRGAVLIDISRGGVVDEQAVLSALGAGQLRGAALDVFKLEPLPADSALWARRNVLLTPHVSGTSPFYIERAIDIFVQNALNLVAGKPLLTSVNVQERY